MAQQIIAIGKRQFLYLPESKKLLDNGGDVFATGIAFAKGNVENDNFTGRLQEEPKKGLYILVYGSNTPEITPEVFGPISNIFTFK